MPDIQIKLPRARKAQEFTVYPFSADEETLKLQSDNYCMIVRVSDWVAFLSKRFAQYPRFAGCSLAAGGKVLELEPEIIEQLKAIYAKPTGSIVSLT